MKIIIILLLVLISFGNIFAQQKDSVKNTFSGRLSEDSRILLNNYKNEIRANPVYPEGRKSPWLAGVFSAIVPGAGEIYTKDYLKAAAFLAVEATALYATLYYNKKADEATVAFQQYADEHWSMVRYAEWLNRFAATLGAQNPPKVQINYDPNLKPWQQVDVSQINAVEELIPTFSHRIEQHGYQQYYELIGKYKEFSPGWDQSDPNNSDYLGTTLQQQVDFSAMFMLPDNTYNKYSSRAVTVILLNHLLSVLDAVWSVHNYNKALTVSMNINHTNYSNLVDYYPTLNLNYRF